MSIRRGSTLIELMVSVSILGVLSSLLMPSIQSARESARANACRSNLRQTGIALQLYAATHRHLPMGAEGRYDRRLFPGTMYGVSWWADTLPFLEEGDLASRLDRKGLHTGWVFLNEQNGTLIDGFAPNYWFCPSSTVDRFVKVAEYRVAAPSYSGISGATNHEGFPETRVNRCCRSEGQISAGGVLVPNTVIRLEQIVDGLSNTLMVGEQSDFAYTDSGQPIRAAASFLTGWLAGTNALGVPPHYSDWLSPSHNLTTVRYPLNEHRFDLPGVYLGVGANNPVLSPHPGIVNLLYCDGSVRAANEELEVPILKSFATRDDGGAMGGVND